MSAPHNQPLVNIEVTAATDINNPEDNPSMTTSDDQNGVENDPVREKKSRQGSSTGINNVDSWRNLPGWNEECRNEDHLWVDTNASGDFCYVSDELCSKSGLKKKCTACKIVSHINCLDHLTFNCRPTYREAGVRTYRDDKSANTILNHHWVHRKRQEGKCKQCGKSFQTKFFNSKDIAAIQCSWCKVAYHNKTTCYQQQFLTEPCSLGIHAGIIVPPAWIIKMPQKNHFKSSVRKQKSSPMKNLPHQHSLNITINSSASIAPADSPFVVKPVPAPHLKPLIVFINPKSGGNQGIKLLHKFQWLLNPRQVFDLSDGGPRRGLEMFGKVPNLRILACGGDGTAGWILSMIDSLGITPCPPLAVLPLGTGNDLARTLNWGAGYEDEPISKILCCVEDGKVVALDRWNIETRLLSANDLGGGIPQSISAQTLDELGNPITIQAPGVERLPLNVCNNYFSLGADAATALEFHESREANPQKFNSRLKNKMFYASVASKDILKRSWRDFFNHVSLQCDGMDLTPRIKELKIHCLLFLNIPRYSAGALPWGSPAANGRFGPQAMDDGLLEVIGLSAASLATLQVGGHGERICQCRNVVLTTSKIIPMQVDGEPCRLLPSTIEISLRNQAFLVKKPKRRTSMSILNDDAEHDLYIGPHQIKLSILVIPLVDYEENPFDRERLRIAATYYGVITVDSDSDLPAVRTQISQLITETGKDLGKWVFLDSTTTDRFFRIDSGLESVHFIMDICSEELYILSSNMSSSLVDYKQTDVHDFVKHILNQDEVKEFTRELEEELKPDTADDHNSAHIEGEVSEVFIKPVENVNIVEGEASDDSVETEVQQEAVKIVSDVLVHAPHNLVEEIPHEPSPSPEILQKDSIEESAEEIDEDETKNDSDGDLLNEIDEETDDEKLKDAEVKGENHEEAGSSTTTHRVYLSSDPVTYTEQSLTKTNKKIEILKSKHQRKFSSKQSLNKAFIQACNQSNVDKVKQLIDRGADFLAVDHQGYTGLHHVAKNGHIGVLHYIINNAPREILELRDYETGQTALHKAAATGRRSVCSLLLSAGALCQARDNNGRTPRQLAESAKDHQLAQFLQMSEEEFKTS